MNSQQILRQAQITAMAQGALGLSPLEVDEGGRRLLCAGSCVARAAIEMHGDQRALQEFDSRVSLEDKDVYLPSIFGKYGLSPGAARRMLKENDRRDSTERLDWFCALKDF